MSNKNAFPYTAYLLRLWPADEQRGAVWRAHLENPLTGERQGFTSLAALVAFLEEVTGEKILPGGEMTGDTAVSSSS
ncbi:MAG: hypothetical protein ACE5FD_11935 [Anaerolineae bacterium]